MVKKARNIIVHVSLWAIGLIVVWLYDFLNLSYFDYRNFILFSLISGTIFNAFIFYLNSEFLMPLVFRKKWRIVKYIFICLLIIIAISFIEGLVDFLFNKLSNPFWDNISVRFSIEYFDLTLLINLLFWIFSIAYSFVLEWSKNEGIKRKVLEDYSQVKLDLLKSEVRPHFLYNTLNNIYALAVKGDNEKVAGSISKLSDLMRYVSYETQEAKIELNKEIEYIENFISLQKLRFTEDDDIDISFHISGKTDDVYIEQLMFLPLIENAFKHGVSLNKKSFIEIKLKVEESKIHFEVINAIHKQKIKKEQSGLGIINLKKRLNHLYQNQHELTFESDEKVFIAKLRIEL